MSKAPDSFMPLWIADYLADTTHLSTLQHGAYLLLLMAYWRNQGPLPNDDDRLRAITRLSAQAWRKIRPMMLEFFAEDDLWWHQKRADAEIARSAKSYDAKVRAGRRGGIAASGKSGRKTNSETIAEPLADEWQNNANSQLTSHTSLRSEDSEAKASASATPPRDFKREVWKAGKTLKIEPSALGEMGKLCREDWPALSELLSRCQAQKPMDPTSWCFAELRPARPPPSHSKPSLAERLTAKIGA